ncbi:hypothetical protein ACFHWV_22975 [Micromonospora sp. LOL_028]|uniref:hypothetical protein n=1 Tax=Micromonospora sp. LOL_028 TaxID=3345420 RepID=UPI003A8BB352
MLDECRVGARFECGPVAVELGLDDGELLAGDGDALLVGVVVLGVGDGLQCGL